MKYRKRQITPTGRDYLDDEVDDEDRRRARNTRILSIAAVVISGVTLLIKLLRK